MAGSEPGAVDRVDHTVHELPGVVGAVDLGHLDGFLYTDVLVGRWTRAAKKAIKREGWGVPGLSWLPGEGRDPFGHDDED